MYVRTPRLCSAYRHSSLSNITLTFFFAGRGGDRSGGAVCLLLRLCPLLRRCFVLDCLFRRPWWQPLWWGRVLASQPVPSASPLLRLHLRTCFVPALLPASKPVLRGLCCGLPVRVCLCSYVNDGLALEALLLLFFFQLGSSESPNKRRSLFRSLFGL